MEEIEIWKDIPGYEGCYQASNLGRVKSLSRNLSRGGHTYVLKERILKPSYNNGGYRFVVLWINKKPKSWKTSSLVAQAFLGHKPCGHKLVVNHIDGNRINDKSSNLEVVTQRENLSICFKVDRNNFTSKYTGVHRQKGRKNWRSSIRINGRITNLGSFKTEIEAADAYMIAFNQLQER